MDVEDVALVLRTLATERPVFHSEADFQHALAWQLHERNPRSVIRLERHISPGIHVDLTIDRGDQRLVVMELKYITHELHTTVEAEVFKLRQHGAQPPRRYDVVSDLVRTERLVAEGIVSQGFVIVLTNESLYWAAGHKIDAIGDAFRIDEGRRLAGELRWAASAAPGTILHREDALHLLDEYIASWRDFSNLRTPHGRFRYLVFAVTGTNGSHGPAIAS